MANETILVVDGDTRSRKVLEVGFNKAGYRVVMTETMREALIELEREQPDLVVSDTDLPDGDGFELCKRVKEDPDLGYVPFLFLTDESSLPNKIKGLEIGADDYLTRPIYLREVTTRATVLLQKRTRKLLSESDVEEFEGELSDITMIDLLQTVEAEDRTGTIHLEREGRDAVVTFRDGNILDAACGKLQGTEAVYRLMLWPSGSFVVRYHDDVRQGDHIEPDTQALIVEGIDRLQIWDSLVERLPSLERTYEADYNVLPDLLDEAPDEVGRIARLFDGVRTLRDVVDDSPMDDITTLQVVERLLDEAVLRDVTPEGEISETDKREATSHLAEWLERQDGGDRADLGLQSDGAVRPEQMEAPEQQQRAAGESAESASIDVDQTSVGNEDDPAATMEDLEKAEEVRRQVEAQQLRQQQGPAGEQESGTQTGGASKKGVPQIPGATQASEQQPPPEQSAQADESTESTEGERDREDTPRAHPASSQDESVEAWLSEGPDVEEFDQTERAGGSETRPQFPAVDIGDEVVEAEGDQSPTDGAADESTVESPVERREEAISRAESVSEQAHPPESQSTRGQQTQTGDAGEASDGDLDPDAGSPSGEDIEETPTEALKTDIRPEDLTDQLQPAGPEAAEADQQAAGEEGPLDVERISTNGEVVQTEYDLDPSQAEHPSTTQSQEVSEGDEVNEATAESLAEETPVERQRQPEQVPETEEVDEADGADFAAPGGQTDQGESLDESAPTGDRHQDGTPDSGGEDSDEASSGKGASSTHEMWVDQHVPDAEAGASGAPQPETEESELEADEPETTAGTDQAQADVEAKKEPTGETEPGGLAWGDEPSARPGEQDETTPAESAVDDGVADTKPEPIEQSETTSGERDAEQAGASSDSSVAQSQQEAPDIDDGEASAQEAAGDAQEIGIEVEGASEPTEQEASSEPDEVDAGERETTPAGGTEMPVEETAEETSEQSEPAEETTTGDASSDEETSGGTDQPDADRDSQSDQQQQEAPDETAVAGAEEITEETKEASFFEEGDELRDTREEDFEWDFEEAESSGSDWQYWAVGAAVLALGVLGVMAATSSGLFGGKTTDGGDKGSSQAEAVGPDDEASPAGADTGVGAVAEADTGGKPDTKTKKRAGLDRVSAKVVVKQQAEDVVSLAESIAEDVEPEQVAQQGGASGDEAGGAAGGAAGGGGGAGGSTAEVKRLMNDGQLVDAYQALKQARQASPGNAEVARLHVQLGSKFQTTNDKNRARQVYRDYLNEWPNGRFAEQLESILQNQL